MNDRDPRLDQWLDEAARIERSEPTPNAERFIARLRTRLRAEPTSTPAPTQRGLPTALAATVLLAITVGLALVWSRSSRVEPPIASAPSVEIPVDLDPADAELLPDLDALVRLVEASGTPPDDPAALEVCDDLEVLQATDFDAFLASLMEENG